jgi:hypothetical protein
MFGERALKTPLYGSGHIPDGIAEMERAVCLLSFDDRYLIIQRWQRRRTYGELAQLTGVTRYRVFRMLKDAESEVHRLLDLQYLQQSAKNA